MKHLSLFLLCIVMFTTYSFAQSTTPGPSLVPGDQAGDVWIYPHNLTVIEGTNFTVEIHANSGTQRLAAYSFDITCDPDKLNPQSVEAGRDGFYTAVGMGSQGFFIISGFDSAGKGPGSDLHVVSINFLSYANACGETTIRIEVDNLHAFDYSEIGSPRGYDGTVIITGCLTLGDVDANGTIDIIDALKTAQYYVGSDVSINTNAADVNCDGSITIIDALLIAQYYVTIIDAFCE